MSAPATKDFDNLAARMPRSQEIAKQDAKVLAKEVVGTVWMPYPFYVERAKGCRITDVDGNEFIDLTGGFGPLILGHSPDVAVKAAQETAEIGMHFGLCNPYQGDLARLVVDAAACGEQAIFCNSGTESTMFAIRAARAHTHKMKIGLFVGSYHGAHEGVLCVHDPKSEPHEPSLLPHGEGIPKQMLDLTVMLPYRHEAAFDLIRQHKDDLAAILIEPVQGSIPRVDQGQFLKGLREVCSECGVLLIFDEVITGFRLGYGGGQEFFGVTPDLATYGKIIGGGLPIGGVVGPKEIMCRFNTPDLGVGNGHAIFAGGTFQGNPMAMRVGTAVVKHLKEHPEIYTNLARESDRFASELNHFLEAGEYPARLMNGQSIFQLIFGDNQIDSAWDLKDDLEQEASRFYAKLHQNGVVVPGVHLFFLSAAHKPSDVDLVLEAFQKSFVECRAEGLF